MALVTTTRAPEIVGLERVKPPRHLWWADQRESLGYPLILIGVWLFTTIAVLDYPTTYQAQEAHLNEVMVGIVAVLNGMGRLLREPTRVSDVIIGLAGAWLVIAPFAVGYSHYSEAGQAAVADIVTGGVLILLAVYSSVALVISERALQSAKATPVSRETKEKAKA
ncbi:SPW repeat domain-containing protein [Streptacidiphilus rugosus]|uniref:SPW repeat domain-containing protein n=1 Tax=Streptacidiphilus rugosus TaxID=405783 RepID=UPI000563737D|nr:SPW repeat protein [Streptacidiphilus rugosus]